MTPLTHTMSLVHHEVRNFLLLNKLRQQTLVLKHSGLADQVKERVSVKRNNKN